jgi:anti-anti-sigma regulatory factor
LGGKWAHAILADLPEIDCLILLARRGRMLKIQRTSNGNVVLSLSGCMDEDHVAELKTLIASEAKGRRIVLDLKNLTLAGQEVIGFLAGCEADGIALVNCAPYVREWITRMRLEG